MRILFVMRHPQYVRNYESTLESLARRGHVIHLGFTPLAAEMGAPTLAERLARDYDSITFGNVPGRSGFWTELVKLVRSLRDRLRYEHEDFRNCPQLSQRASTKAETVTRWLTQWLVRDLTPTRVQRLDKLLNGTEAVLPTAPRVVKTIQELRPDVVLVTPMVDLGSQQRDYVKAARALGIPSALCVASWDNLTNKGLIQTQPDRVFVWNEHQRQEALRYHGVTDEQVVATGAQCYDHWFDRDPSTTREQFRRRVGLPTTDRFVAYLSSSKFIAPREADFVARWIQALRNSGDPLLRDVQIVVRPHPGNPQDWSVVDDLRDPKVVVWPRDGQAVHGEEARANYFDTFYHAATAVGVNTSAMVEAGIAGCVCHTIRVPEFAGTQDGTLHFAHLLRGGYVRAAEGLSEHTAQLADTLRNPGAARAALDRFLSDFIRPFGLDEAGTPRLVSQIEQLAAHQVPVVVRTALSVRLTRAALSPAAATLLVLRGLVTSNRAGRKAARSNPPQLSYRGWHWPNEPASSKAEHSRRHESGTGLGSHARQVGRYLENAVWQPQRVARWMRRAARSEAPILLGPWLSEVGFELLYWIPMMRHYLRTYGISPSRVIAVSRGGVASWYDGMADRYVEIFDLMSTAEFHQRNEQREGEAGGKKQISTSSLDRAILRAAAEQVGVESPVVLHPQLMYQLMRGFWRGRFPLSFVKGHCDFEPLTGRDALPELPFSGPYCTAKFYYSSCFPETRANAALVSRLVRGLARKRPVVLLGTGLKVDDHDDWSGDEQHNVFSAQDWMKAGNNLAVQSALVAGSSGLYCTYGGFSYLAPLLGRPVTSVFSEQNFVPSHLQLAEEVFNGAGGPFAAVPAESLGRWLDDLSPVAASSYRTAEQAA